MPQIDYMPSLYIIAGCNGSGKTTASFTILPKILSCKEFVNADEIARGISPFQPNEVALESGRIMLQRINELLDANEDFAVETTLASKLYKNFITKAKQRKYETTLVFLWLNSVELAVERVKIRVNEGGHDIPLDTIIRRYKRGLLNFFSLYKNLTKNWIFIDNSGVPYKEIAQSIDGKIDIFNNQVWQYIKDNYEKNNI